MEIINYLNDNQWPLIKTTHTREIVRAVVLDENDNVALTKLYGDDMFGHRDYYELPGGGVKENESKLFALQREMEEELGYRIALIAEVGEVIDFYNLIGRENHNYFYLARRKEFVGQRLEPNEKKLIQSIVYVPLNEAIKLYEAMSDEGVSVLVKKRELPILLKAREIIEEKNRLERSIRD